MSVRRFLIAAAVLLLVACGDSGPPAGTVATVNGKAVPKVVYDLLVKSTEASMQKAGIPLRSGDSRTVKVQAAALKGAVHDGVVEQLSADRKVTATPAEVTDALAKVEAALGGKNQLDLRLEGSGLTRDEYATLYHYTLLEQKMRNADPGYDKAFAKKLADAKVQAYVGPCSANHDYPKCVDGTAGS